jgi:hypothetical protein
MTTSSHDADSTTTASDEKSLSRQRLYELVWAEPMIKIAARYGVSSSYLARVCTRLRVPRPARGYWAKLAVGIQSKLPSLPEARPGDELAWNREGYPAAAPVLPRPPAAKGNPVLLEPSKPLRKRLTQHNLINGVKQLFETARVSSYADPKYLKPAKKLLVDLCVTKTGLDYALKFANQLFLELEAQGHRVVIAPHGEMLRRESVEERENPPKREHGYHHRDQWSPFRCTVVYVGTVAIGLTIIEMSEAVQVRHVNGEYIRESEYVAPKHRYGIDRTWTTTKNLATGRLCLQAYSPYHGAERVWQWKESEVEKLIDRTPVIVEELGRAAEEISRLVAEAKRRAEAQEREWQIAQQKRLKEEADRRVAAALKDSKEELLQFIARWVEARNLERFFAEVESDIAKLGPDSREQLMERLEAARELLDAGSALEQLKLWKTPKERFTG